MGESTSSGETATRGALLIAERAVQCAICVLCLGVIAIIVFVSYLLYDGGYTPEDFVNTQQRPFYNIAHMTNTPKAIDYAVSAGANAIEIDLVFDWDTSLPKRWFHGYPCDCTCATSGTCTVENDLSCDGETPVAELLRHAQQISKLQMVLIDSKVNPKIENLTLAGEKGAEQAWLHLFGGNASADGMPEAAFQGVVVIGMASSETSDYLKGAFHWTEANMPAWAKRRTMFSIDEDHDASKTMKTMVDIGIPKQRRMMGTGVTACKLGAARCTALGSDVTNARLYGEFAAIYGWTVDIAAEMMLCTSGVQVDGVVTNFVARLANNHGRTLAGPASSHPFFNTPTLLAGTDIKIMDDSGDELELASDSETFPGSVALTAYKVMKGKETTLDVRVVKKDWVDSWAGCPDVTATAHFLSDATEFAKKVSVSKKAGGLSFLMKGTVSARAATFAKIKITLDCEGGTAADRPSQFFINLSLDMSRKFMGMVVAGIVVGVLLLVCIVFGLWKSYKMSRERMSAPTSQSAP